jgi:DNA-directed RNA polymerase subunit RPC12/RpoP
MKKPYYIDYPQEHFEGFAHRYRCAFCKEETTIINGRLEGHLPHCDYRIALEKAGYDADCNLATETIHSTDEND